MRSNEVAKLAGVTVRTLRHYHQLGLLSEPPRQANGYRDYSPADVARVLRIKRLAGLGFPLSRIGDVLDEMDAEGNATSASALDELDRELALEIEHLQEQRRTIAELRAEHLDPDLPVRFARILRMLSGVDTLADARAADRTALIVAGHLYDDEALGELERVVERISSENLVEAMEELGRRLDALTPDAPERERAALAEDSLAALAPVIACFDTANWLRPPNRPRAVPGRDRLRGLQRGPAGRVRAHRTRHRGRHGRAGAKGEGGRRPFTILRSSMLISFGVVMVMGSFQGLVLPVHFTAANSPELLGYVLSAMSAGMLASSLGYAALAHKLRRRTWYILSLTGMALGILGLGLLPSLPLLIASALMLGLSAGPISALLGFFIFDRIPAENRGSALGTQNSLTLAAAPVAVFATSLVVEGAGVSVAALALAGCWMLITVWALNTHSLKYLDDKESHPDPIPFVPDAERI